MQCRYYALYLLLVQVQIIQCFHNRFFILIVCISNYSLDPVFRGRQGCLGPFAHCDHNLFVTYVRHVARCIYAGYRRAALLVGQDFSRAVGVEDAGEQLAVGREADLNEYAVERQSFSAPVGRSFVRRAVMRLPSPSTSSVCTFVCTATLGSVRSFSCNTWSALRVSMNSRTVTEAQVPARSIAASTPRIAAADHGHVSACVERPVAVGGRRLRRGRCTPASPGTSSLRHEAPVATTSAGARKTSPPLACSSRMPPSMSKRSMRRLSQMSIP